MFFDETSDTRDRILRVSKLILRENKYLPSMIFSTENPYSKLIFGRTFLSTDFQ